MRKFFTTLSLVLCIAMLHAQADSLKLVPKPLKIEVQNGHYLLKQDSRIQFSTAEAKPAAQFLQQALRVYNMLSSAQQEIKTANVRFFTLPKLEKEAYSLRIDAQGVQIGAAGSTGWFYGVQTLSQLMASAKITDAGLQLPLLSIEDKPRFKWRAFMLDESRHFKGMDEVKLLLDEMAYLKMNIFHWHLVDDQGWRVEIKKYPKLTSVGAYRRSTQIGPKHWKSKMQSGEPHGGFYTQEQIKELVRYAAERHITIVPEIEMPGHSSAAIAAYPWLGTAKQKMEVPTVFGVAKDVYDVADPKVVAFLQDVLDEIFELFPGKVIHIGGDEVKYNHWKNSKSVQAYMQKQGLQSPAELQVFFTNKISQYIESKGRRMMGWNEIMGHNLHEYQDEEDTQNEQELAKSSVIHFWKGDPKLATEAASNGYELVNSLHWKTYLDYGYNSISLCKAYNFDPIPEGLDAKFHSKVLGSGCQMWSEWVPTRGQMHFQVFPRIAAYAEVGWTALEQKDYDQFHYSLGMLKTRWIKRGIHFAPETEYEP